MLCCGEGVTVTIIRQRGACTHMFGQYAKQVSVAAVRLHKRQMTVLSIFTSSNIVIVSDSWQHL